MRFASITAFTLGLLFASAVPANAGGPATGPGYNFGARVFVGTVMQWCMAKVGDQTWCDKYYGRQANDHLVMKWSKAWDMAVFGPDGIRYSGDELAWNTDAWEDNEVNGMFPGGSGTTEHFKARWIGGNCGADYTQLADGGYCIWGAFEALIDQGQGPDGRWVLAFVKPSGYGAK